MFLIPWTCSGDGNGNMATELRRASSAWAGRRRTKGRAVGKAPPKGKGTCCRSGQRPRQHGHRRKARCSCPRWCFPHRPSSISSCLWVVRLTARPFLWNHRHGRSTGHRLLLFSRRRPTPLTSSCLPHRTLGLGRAAVIAEFKGLAQ